MIRRGAQWTDGNRRNVADIRKRGWSALNVSDGDPPFIYTVGLMETWAHPELIVFGMPPKHLSGILSAMVHTIRNGASYSTEGTYPGILQGEVRIAVRKVDPTQHQVYLGYALGHARMLNQELTAMQVFWPDKIGKFPYEVGCDLAVYQRQRPARSCVGSPRPKFAEFERDGWGCRPVSPKLNAFRT